MGSRTSALRAMASSSTPPPTNTATPPARRRSAAAAAAAASSPAPAPSSPAVAPPRAALVEKAERIRAQLAKLYPKPAIPLDHENHFQLLVAVMLSAQSTDKKVNEVTPALFAAAGDAAAMAALDVAAIEAAIKQVGLAPTKAKNVRATAQALLERHGGAVPRTFAELEALPGVGHKTASVVMAQAFGLPAFPVDTHIHRLAQRWGLVATPESGRPPTVEATERDLKALWPPEAWIIFFGREHCPAQRHDPLACPICSWAAVAPYDGPGASPAKAAGGKGAAAAKGGGKGAQSPAQSKRKGAAVGRGGGQAKGKRQRRGGGGGGEA